MPIKLVITLRQQTETKQPAAENKAPHNASPRYPETAIPQSKTEKAFVISKKGAEHKTKHKKKTYAAPNFARTSVENLTGCVKSSSIVPLLF